MFTLVRFGEGDSCTQNLAKADQRPGSINVLDLEYCFLLSKQVKFFVRMGYIVILVHYIEVRQSTMK